VPVSARAATQLERLTLGLVIDLVNTERRVSVASGAQGELWALESRTPTEVLRGVMTAFPQYRDYMVLASAMQAEPTGVASRTRALAGGWSSSNTMNTMPVAKLHERWESVVLDASAGRDATLFEFLYDMNLVWALLLSHIDGVSIPSWTVRQWA